MSLRKEKDFLGEKEVSEEAYWGIHTQRALENFPISGYRIHPSLVRSLAMVKKACCQANLLFYGPATRLSAENGRTSFLWMHFRAVRAPPAI
jgi:fumarate hydratase class II